MKTGSENVEKQSCGSERRRACRKNVIERQLVTVELGAGRTGILIDISEDGIAIQPFRPLAIRTHVTVEFDLPRAGGRIVGEGTVVWVGRSGRAGVRFSQLTQRSWCSLDQWLRIVEDPLAEVIRDYTSHTLDQSTSDESSSQNGNGLTLDTVLDLITERACTATHADGAAFLVQTPSGFVCCSSLGIAPDPGVMVKPQSLTGESLRFGVTLNCGNVPKDSRVNTELSETPSVASVIVAPILVGDRVMGGIEVLSSTMEAFAERDAARLKRLAEISSKLADDFTDLSEVEAENVST